MPGRRVPWIPVVAIWTAFALILAMQTWLSMITHGHSPLRLLAHQFSVWAFWAAITPLLIGLTRRYPVHPFDARNWLVHGGAMAVVVPTHIVYCVALTIAIRPYDAMTQAKFEGYFPTTLLASLPLEVALYAAVVATAQALELFSRASRLERALGDARIHALEQQIRPHFLFNALNAASALVRGKRNTEAVDVIAALSDLLRYSLDHSGDQRVSLETEMAMLERYLAIQRVRFPDRLEVSIEMDENACRAEVPTLLLQPLAENAIRHGIEPKSAPGRVRVRARRIGERLEVEMFNTGTLTGAANGIGLSNTEERLRQLYGSAAQLTLEETEGGVLARVVIPWKERG